MAILLHCNEPCAPGAPPDKHALVAPTARKQPAARSNAATLADQWQVDVFAPMSQDAGTGAEVSRSFSPCVLLFVQVLNLIGKA